MGPLGSIRDLTPQVRLEGAGQGCRPGALPRRKRGRAVSALAQPERCSWEGSDCPADFFARRGVSKARASARPVTSERRSSCERRSSKHDRSNCIVPAQSRPAAGCRCHAAPGARKRGILAAASCHEAYSTGPCIRTHRNGCAISSPTAAFRFSTVGKRWRRTCLPSASLRLGQTK